MSLFASLLHKPGRSFAMALIAGCALAIGAAGASAELVQGKNYDRVKNPQPTESGKKIEVLEFFSYGCPHCAELEPFLETWLAKLPPDVEFHRVPVAFQDRWVPLGKIYYTLDVLGEERKLSPEVFQAIHQQGKSMWNDKTFFDWAASKGIDRKKAEDTFNSFAIQGKMNRARQLAQAYNIQSVPTVVIDGKFITSSDRVGTHSALPAAIDELIVKARAERPKG
ncbi:MAG TPA: thiol:disulfide interchange protein DsbA/DsbL [Casimicrobiaceae bacterium]|nr:thiol:disulfide interchange protein DsbA/DsbL [Casimicrobiaceae bacterium]